MSIKSANVAKAITVILLALVSTCAIALGNDGSGDGVITDRNGNILTVKTQDGPVTVVVSNETKVQQYAGAFSKKAMPDSVLIPGLKLSYGGTRAANGTVTAKDITFYSDDLALAEVIKTRMPANSSQPRSDCRGDCRSRPRNRSQSSLYYRG